MAKIQDVRLRMPGGNDKRMLSQIKNIARHHSATPSGDAFSFADYHVNHHGWKTSGYHEIILRDGTVQIAYDPEVITNGVGGHNMPTYHICVVGNGSFTEAQEKAFDERAKYNMNRLNLSASDVKGHNEFSGTSTSCPGINMNTVRNRLRGNSSPTPEHQIKSASVAKPKWKKVTGNWTGQTLGNGEYGEPVRQLQTMLANNNPPFYPNKGAKNNGIDSYFGDDTEDAVRRFQSYYGLDVDGLAGKQVYNKLGGIKPSAKPKKKPSKSLPNSVYRATRPYPNGSDVRAVQEALASVYYYPDKGAKNNGIDGFYGPNTADAVRRFQLTHGLTADGIYGPATKKALEKAMR